MLREAPFPQFDVSPIQLCNCGGAGTSVLVHTVHCTMCSCALEHSANAQHSVHFSEKCKTASHVARQAPSSCPGKDFAFRAIGIHCLRVHCPIQLTSLDPNSQLLPAVTTEKFGRSCKTWVAAFQHAGSCRAPAPTAEIRVMQLTPPQLSPSLSLSYFFSQLVSPSD